jgi:hypothetical protein
MNKFRNTPFIHISYTIHAVSIHQERRINRGSAQFMNIPDKKNWAGHAGCKAELLISTLVYL